MNTYASKPWRPTLGKTLTLALLLPLLSWYMAIPRVRFFFSADGREEISYILNTQHNIDKDEIQPGKGTSGFGHIFPDKDFFMEFYWEISGHQHCVRINPKWRITNIYIGPDGNIDKSLGGGTDIDRLESCRFDDRTF